MGGRPKSTNGPDTAELELGFRRVTFVRVVRDGDHSTCEVHGVGHRLPAVRRVSLATATVLAARGVPVVVREAS